MVRFGLSRTSCLRYEVAVELPDVRWEGDVQSRLQRQATGLTLSVCVYGAAEYPRANAAFWIIQVPFPRRRDQLMAYGRPLVLGLTFGVVSRNLLRP